MRQNLIIALLSVIATLLFVLVFRPETHVVLGQNATGTGSVGAELGVACGSMQGGTGSAFYIYDSAKKKLAVYFLGNGVTAVMKGQAEKIKLGSFPTVREVMDQAAKAGVKMLVCGQSCQMLGLKGAPEEFQDPAKVVGAATLNDLVLEYDAVLSF